MAKLKVVRPRHSIVYAIKLLRNEDLSEWKHQHVEIRGPGGEPVTMVFHSIHGTREEIREQLLQSIDAFFELSDEKIL